MYAGFVGCTAVTLVPLIQVVSMPIIFDALIATGVTMGGLGAVAYNAPSEQFLSWGGPLSLGLGGMCAVGLLSMLYPGSAALHNLWLYGGVALFSALVLYDTQRIMHNAKTHYKYDPLDNSIRVYLHAIQLFIRFVQIFAGSKRK